MGVPAAHPPAPTALPPLKGGSQARRSGYPFQRLAALPFLSLTRGTPKSFPLYWRFPLRKKPIFAPIMLGYLFLRFVVGLFWLIPFWLLYGLSNGLYYLLYYLLRYRLKVVRENLKIAFPEKTESERRSIERQFYRHLCDISLESLKGLSSKSQEIRRRYQVLNAEKIDAYTKAGRSVIIVGAHLGNWEWAAVGAPQQIQAPMVVLYQPIVNQRIDAYVRQQCARHAQMRPSRYTRQAFEEFSKQPTVFAMIADQSPSNREEAHRTQFFNRSTPTLHGVAKYAQLHNFPIVFFHIRRSKRGFYEVWEEPLIDQPAEWEAEAISQCFMSKIEAAIRAEPHIWLWSHRRWKYE